MRHLFCGGLAGLLSGVVFLGLGSRLVMRIAAILDPAAEGLATDNGNVVGEVTLDGTLELVIFEGLFGGLIAGLLWVLVREWLPVGPSRVAFAGVAAGLLGSFLVVSAENPDFNRLEPSEVNVAMFIAVVGLTGSGAAVLDSWLQRRLPSSRNAALVLSLLTIAGGVLSIPLVAQAFLSEDFCGCQDPPRLAAPFIVLLAAANVVSWRHWLVDGTSSVNRSGLRKLGIAGVAGACIFAGIDLIDEVRAIL